MHTASPTTGVEPRLVSIKAAAHVLGVGTSSIWKYIGDGRLQAVKLGRRRLVPIESINALIDNLTGGKAA